MAILNGVIENGGVRGEAGYLEFLDITLQGCAIEQSASDVVEPRLWPISWSFCVVCRSIPP
jgi:hypothetical protein